MSGGTEADNLAILGTVRTNPAAKKHVVTTAIEHPAVLNPCRQLEREGVEVTYVRVGSDGVVDPEAIRRALRPETVLISVMHANNELGTVQPIQEIAGIAREAGVLSHSDGVQAAGKIPVDVKALGVDLYSISGHKLYAPKGIGALYVKPGTPLAPIQFGGRHERERRPGTENVSGAVALGQAAECALRGSSGRDGAARGVAGSAGSGNPGAGSFRRSERRRISPDAQHDQYLFRWTGGRGAGNFARPERLRCVERIGVFERRGGAVARAAGHRIIAGTRAGEPAFFAGTIE